MYFTITVYYTSIKKKIDRNLKKMLDRLKDNTFRNTYIL